MNQKKRQFNLLNNTFDSMDIFKPFMSFALSLLKELLTYLANLIRSQWAKLEQATKWKIIIGCSCSLSIATVGFFLGRSLLPPNSGAVPVQEANAGPYDENHFTFQPCSGAKVNIDTNLIINDTLRVCDVYRLAPKGSCLYGAYNIIRVPAARTVILKLQDSSTVRINAATSIFIPPGFGETHRELKIEGEAFFDIVQDAFKPFKVSAGKLQAIVLGTSFNIRCYPKLNYIQLGVVTGKVQVEGSAPLGRDTCATLNLETGLLEFARLDPLTLEWMTGQYTLERRTLRESCQEAERCYKAKIVIPDEDLAETVFTTFFERGKSVETFLRALKVYDIKSEFKNGTWHLAKQTNQ